MTRRVADLVELMETFAPARLAAEWDNVGLLLGSRDDACGGVLLTIDLTEAVLDEALARGATTIVAYHPPIFQPLKSLADGSPREAMLLRAARNGLAIYSPHTALDAAPGGINDWLAASFGSGDVRALRPAAHLPTSEATKIITFCPVDAVERLRAALGTIGAGRIGAYEQCSFETTGTGTFHGTEGSTPVIGQKGRIERVPEVRLEMVCPRRSLSLAMTTIRQFHPYEEPPIEIHGLEPRPSRNEGEGRRVMLDRAVGLRTIVNRVKEAIRVPRLHVAVAPGVEKFQAIGVCAGAGGSMYDEALREGCHLYFTGEMRHHDVLAAQARGCTVILAGHTNSERGYLRVLRDRLAAALEGVEIMVSERDRDPLDAM